MPPKDFKCKQCGNCCQNLLDAFCASVPEEDVELWEMEERYDILEWVVPLGLSDGKSIGYDVWISPHEHSQDSLSLLSP